MGKHEKLSPSTTRDSPTDPELPESRDSKPYTCSYLVGKKGKNIIPM